MRTSGFGVLFVACCVVWGWGLAAGRPADAQETTETTQNDLLRRAYDASKTAESIDELNEVINLCEEVLEGKPSAARRKYSLELLGWAYNKRGDAYAADEQEDKAAADYRAAVEADDANWRAIHNRGVSRAMAGDYEAALADFDRTIRLEPGFAKAWFNRGEIRFAQGDYATAVRDYSEALKLAPRDAATLVCRGVANVRQGAYQPAIEDYTAAIRIEPNALAYTYRAEAYSDMGRFAEAVSDYQEAVRIDPEFGRAYQSSAWLRATCPSERYRHPDVALRSARRAIELDGEGDYRYLDTLAAALANNGEYEEAVDAQQRAIELASSESDVIQRRLKDRLETYRAQRPYRDPTLASAGRRR